MTGAAQGDTNPALDFLSGGGGMGARVRAHDWAETPLGPPERWPGALKTLAGVMLGSNQPMFVAWGPERILVYNDAYAEILAAKHPSALGGPFLDVWSEIRADLVPIVEQAYSGVPVSMDDITLLMHRRGYQEEAHFAFSYTPLRDDSGAIAGLFCACTETTGQVLAERRLRESESRLRIAQAAGGIGTFELEPHTGRILVSPQFCRIWGVPELAETHVSHFLALIHPDDQERVRTGERVLPEHALHPIEYRIVRPDTGETRWLARRGEAVRDELTGDTRWLGVVYDVTEHKQAEDALKEREEQLSAFIDQATAGFAQVDLQGTFTLINERFCEIAGRTRAELLQLRMQDITHPDDLVANIPKFDRAVREGTPYVHEKRYVRPDGSHVWVNNSVSVIRRNDGEPFGVLAVSIDVTERRAAEAAVRENEARLRALTDNLPGGMVYQVSTGLNGEERRFLFVSQSSERLTGLTADAILADPTLAYSQIDPEDGPLLAAAEEEAIGARKPFDVQVRFRRADGVQRWARIISAPRLTSGGGTVWDGIMIDVTEQKSAEVLLRDMNETLEQRVAERTAERDRAWRATQDILLTLVGDGTFTQANPAWTRILGYSEAETVGRSFREFIHPDDIEPTEAALAHATLDAIAHVRNRYRHKDGSYRWISWMAAPAGDYVYASGRDFTAEQEAAEELALAQEALRQSQKMEAMGQLTGGVAHDFNNLLTPIIGSLDLLLRKGLGGGREQRMVEGALQSAERAKTLVQRLLAFARRQPLKAGPVDVPELIRGMADLVASTSGPQIRIHTDIPAALPFALADANQLELAILNLAVNARDAMPDGGAITIAARAETVDSGHPSKLAPGPYVRLTVADTGTGMDAETLARAIEPFFSTKGVGHGTGLGLSMVHGLAAQLGGALILSSAPGEGTAAHLWLRVSDAAPAALHAATLAAPTPTGAGTVLLVDDEPLVRASTADMLTELGYTVLEAASAAQALRTIEGRAIDFVVTDHAMPGQTGTDLARTLAARERPIPVLIISGYAEMEGAPADLPRLTKPFRQADLAESIARLRQD
jgi:PAS domain S-box-containing protein